MMKFEDTFDRTCVISTSYGNDSVALVQYIYNLQSLDLTRFKQVITCYCDTGWAASDWEDRVRKAEEWVKELGFTSVRTKSLGMEELVRMKKCFPANQVQFCTQHLKGVPFLSWIDEYDPECTAVVCVGKRRAESKARANTPEFVHESEFHGGRLLWHPLYAFSDEQRNEILKESPFEILPHRSKECSPCVNANRGDFKLLTPVEIERVCKLEVEIGQPMFRPKRFGAVGIHGVMAWALFGRSRENVEPGEISEGSGCDGHYGCGL